MAARGCMNGRATAARPPAGPLRLGAQAARGTVPPVRSKEGHPRPVASPPSSSPGRPLQKRRSGRLYGSTACSAASLARPSSNEKRGSCPGRVVRWCPHARRATRAREVKRHGNAGGRPPGCVVQRNRGSLVRVCLSAVPAASSPWAGACPSGWPNARDRACRGPIPHWGGTAHRPALRALCGAWVGGWGVPLHLPSPLRPRRHAARKCMFHDRSFLPA